MLGRRAWIFVLAMSAGLTYVYFEAICYAARRSCASQVRVLREDSNQIVAMCVDVDGHLTREFSGGSKE